MARRLQDSANHDVVELLKDKGFYALAEASAALLEFR